VSPASYPPGIGCLTLANSLRSDHVGTDFRHVLGMIKVAAFP
jgi:hypothetical protein